MDQPTKHVIRVGIPWHDEQLTECGFPVSDYPSAWLRGEIRELIDRCGYTDVMASFCCTCWRAGVMWDHLNDTWERNPLAVLQREYKRIGSRQVEPRGTPNLFAANELLSIEELVRRHRDEFDEIKAEADDDVLTREIAALRQRLDQLEKGIGR